MECGFSAALTIFGIVTSAIAAWTAGIMYGSKKEIEYILSVISSVSGNTLTPEERFYLFLVKDKILYALENVYNRRR